MREGSNQVQNQNEQQNQNNDNTKTFTQEQINNGKVMAMLCYLSILVLIPYFSEKSNPYVKYHAKQGINLFIYEAIFAALDSFLSRFTQFFGFIAYLGLVALFLLSVIGFVYVLNGEAKKIPFLDKFSIVK